MAIVIDYVNELILFTSPTTEVDGQTLHDFVQDEAASPAGMGQPWIDQSDPQNDTEILYPDGKIEDPNNPGVYSQIILRLNPRWQMQFWGGSGYTRLYGAKFVGGISGQPMKATGTAGDITVMESPVDGVTVVSGSGLSTIQATMLEELHKLQGLLLGKPMTVTPTSRQVDDIDLEITGDGETSTTVTRQP